MESCDTSPLKATGLNLTKQLLLLIWNHESNLLGALGVKLS